MARLSLRLRNGLRPGDPRRARDRAGYLLDTTVGFHLTGSDYLIEHTRDFARVAGFRVPGARSRTTSAPVSKWRPHLLGGSGRLLGRQHLAISAIPLAAAGVLRPDPLLPGAQRIPSEGSRCGRRRPGVDARARLRLRADGRDQGADGASLRPAAGRDLVMFPRLLALGWRRALVPALVAAAGIGGIGLAFLPWFAATLVAGLCLVLAGGRRELLKARPVITWGAALAIALILLAIPTFGPLTESIRLARGFRRGNVVAVADPGNLLRPLLNEQMVGVWLNGTHRLDPGAWLAGDLPPHRRGGGGGAARGRMGAQASPARTRWVRRSRLFAGVADSHRQGRRVDGREAARDHVPGCDALRLRRCEEPVASRPRLGRCAGPGDHVERSRLERVHLSRHQPGADGALRGAAGDQ